MAAQDLTLAEYARVQAHVAERHPLDEVLSHFGVEKRRWALAEQRWSQVLATDPTLLGQYTTELDRAVDAVARRVRPIDDDAASWLTFLAVYTTQEDPFAWLEQHDLGVNDLSRLNRAWERRCREDGDLAKRFAALGKDAAGRALPKIVADPRKPLPPAAPAEAAAPHREAASVTPKGRAPIDLYAYAALTAELSVAPERRDELVAERGLSKEAVAAAAAWYAARFEAAPEERKDFDHLVAHNRERAARARRAPGAADHGGRGPTPAASVWDEASSVGLRALPTDDDLDRTAELTGQVLAASLPFRAAMPQDAERMAQHTPARSRQAADPLDATGELPNAPLARALPFDGAGGDAAIVTAIPWRGADGRMRTTVVGKLSVYLQAGAPAAVGPSDPLVAFDRISPDQRFVDEASETAPWAVTASILTYGGPLRFTFHPASGAPLQVGAARGAPVGRSMSNPERARYAPRGPTRGKDGILTIPDEIDGRYFVAAPPTQQTSKIVGDERVVLEVGGAAFDTKLPAVVIVVTALFGGQRRVARLPFDTLAVHGDRRRIDLVGRATLPGEATLVGHTLAPLDGASPPRRSALASTTALPDARFGALPATPFEGRAPAAPPPAVVPRAEDEKDRAGGKKDATGVEPAPMHDPAPAQPKHVIATPKRGAMAKPRVKRH